LQFKILKEVTVISQKISVGVIGATGVVAQKYIRLLSQNPWFEVTPVADSPCYEGKRDRDAVAGR
jgi:aspartate-semialdehyde dehydrogenase